jgi:hypothetical protein
MARWAKAWSEEDLNKLRSLAGTKSIRAIAEELDRTIGSVLAKAADEKLNLHRQSERR